MIILDVEDLHYSGHELVRLKTVDKMVVQAVKKVPEAEVNPILLMNTFYFRY